MQDKKYVFKIRAALFLGGLLSMAVFLIAPHNANAALINFTGELGHFGANGAYVWNVSSSNAIPNTGGFNTPQGTAIDTVNHRLFVTDQQNQRIMVFMLNASDNVASVTASYVLGQTDLVFNNLKGVTQNTLNTSTALAYDAANQRLFVADTGANRVLVFNVAPGTIANGENASYVIGQSNFTLSNATTTQSGLSNPNALTYDPSDTLLFVSDQGNNRVLAFNVASGTIANGENASYVIGQTSFTSSNAATTQSGLSGPAGLTYDSAGQRLFVSDAGSLSAAVGFDKAASTTQQSNVSSLAWSQNVTSSQSALVAVVGVEWSASTTAIGISSVTFGGSSMTLLGSQVGATSTSAQPGNGGQTALYYLLNPSTGTQNATVTFNGTTTAIAGSLTLYNVSLSSPIDATSTNVGQLKTSGSTLIPSVTRTTNNDAVVISVGSASPGGSPTLLVGGVNPIWNVAAPANGKALLDFIQNAGPAGVTTGAYGTAALTANAESVAVAFAPSASNRVLVFSVAPGTIANGENASYVIGQTSFTSSNAATTQSGLSGPGSLDYDSASNRLFVADGSSRVMVFNATPGTIANGENASNVLGQSSFTISGATTTQSGLSAPVGGLAYDSVSQNLFTVDTGNNRVMVFAAGTSTIASGENASNELGEHSDATNMAPTYTRSAVNNSPNSQGLSGSGAIALDTVNHRLFTGETSNDRILVFQLDANDHISQTAPSYVLGKPDFTTVGSLGRSQSLVASVHYLTYDSANQRLFVSDTGNNRVMVFNVATSTIANGENASYVLGQADFTAFSFTVSQSTLSNPDDLGYDSINQRLFVSDSGFNRVMVFNVATSTIANGENASYELGQPNFTTTNGASLSQSTFNGLNSGGLPYDSINQRLFVSDLSGNRVMVFNVATSTIANDENASYVLGQTNFTTGTATTTQSSCNCADSAYDASRNLLMVNDFNHARVMFFNVATSTISNGENAMAMIGQATFTTSTISMSQNHFQGVGSTINDPVQNVIFEPESSAGNRVDEIDLIRIATPSVSNGTVGSGYSQTISTAASQGTVSFSVYAGSLPTGLSLSASTGVISGTPTVATTTTVTIEADDTYSDTSVFFDRATYTMQMNGSSQPMTTPEGTLSIGNMKLNLKEANLMIR